MKKIVISGSSSLQDKVNYWVEYFKNKNYEFVYVGDITKR